MNEDYKSPKRINAKELQKPYAAQLTLDGTTYKTPRRPFEKDRILEEIEICGNYGLKNKREVWRVQFTLAKIRKAARTLLTLEENDPKRLFEGRALIKRLVKYGLLKRTGSGLDDCLALTIPNLMERRLQTRVHQSSLAQSIHQARTKVKHRHISVDNQLVNAPSFVVSVENDTRIQHATISPFASGRPSRKQKFVNKSK